MYQIPLGAKSWKNKSCTRVFFNFHQPGPNEGRLSTTQKKNFSSFKFNESTQELTGRQERTRAVSDQREQEFLCGLGLRKLNLQLLQLPHNFNFIFLFLLVTVYLQDLLLHLLWMFPRYGFSHQQVSSGYLAVVLTRSWPQTNQLRTRWTSHVHWMLFHVKLSYTIPRNCVPVPRQTKWHLLTVLWRLNLARKMYSFRLGTALQNILHAYHLNRQTSYEMEELTLETSAFQILKSTKCFTCPWTQQNSFLGTNFNRAFCSNWEKSSTSESSP